MHAESGIETTMKKAGIRHMNVLKFVLKTTNNFLACIVCIIFDNFYPQRDG